MNVEPEPSQIPSISRCNRQRLSEYFLVHHCTLVAPLSPGHALSSPSVTSPSGVVLTLVAQWMSRRMRLSAMRAFSSAVAWAKARPSPANAELNDAVRVPRMMESTTMTTSSSISVKPAADLRRPFTSIYPLRMQAPAAPALRATSRTSLRPRSRRADKAIANARRSADALESVPYKPYIGRTRVRLKPAIECLFHDRPGFPGLQAGYPTMLFSLNVIAQPPSAFTFNPLTPVERWMSIRMRLSDWRAFYSAVARTKARSSPAIAEVSDVARAPRMMENNNMTVISSTRVNSAADLRPPLTSISPLRMQATAAPRARSPRPFPTTPRPAYRPRSESRAPGLRATSRIWHR